MLKIVSHSEWKLLIPNWGNSFIDAAIIARQIKQSTNVVFLCSSITTAFLIGLKIDCKSSTSRKKLRRQMIEIISALNNCLSFSIN